MGSYTTNFLWNHPKPGDGLYNYSDGMINTPDTPATLNFTGGLLNTDAANNFSLFNHANAAPRNNTELEKGMTFGNRISSIAQDPMELYRTGMSRRDYAPDPNSVATRNSFIHNKYGLPEYQGELTGIPHRGDMSGRANLQEFGTEHFPIAPDKKRSFSLPNFGFSGILKGLKNQFEYKGAENTAFDPNTGQYLTAEEQDKLNARGGWYSDAARYDRRQRKRVANMLHRRNVLKKDINDERLERMIKKGYGEDKTITPASSGPGTKAVYEEHGWTQPTYHDDAFTSPRDSESAFGGDFSGAGPSRHARGGRVGYNEGGRVGILSVF